MKMKLEDLTWSKRHWEMTAPGGTWVIPQACVVMQRTPRGFSLVAAMPFLPELAAAANEGYDVPKTAEALLKHQQDAFNLIKERFNAAGLDFDDPQGLLK